MAAVDSEPRARTYGNWRRPVSAGIGGLGMIGTAIMMGGLIVVVLLVMFAGLLPAAVFAAVVGVVLLLLVVKDKHGKTGVQRAGARAGWWVTRQSGSHLYRSGPLGRTPWGRFQLPGLAARSELWEFRDSYARPFALIHMPTTGHFTVVFSCEPDGASLVDEEQVDVWVAQWGHWLASLGHEPGLVSASVTVETAPDTGTRLRREVQTNMVDDAPDVARAMLTEVVRTYPEGSASVRAWVALTFTASTRAGKRRAVEDMGRDLASRLPGLSLGLNATGAGTARPMTAQDLCEVIRVAYDPAAALLIEEAHAEGQTPELAWADAGPTATQAAWDHYRHDGAVSRTWTMTSAPRGEVFSSVLSQLLAPHGDVDRKRVTLLYRPLDAAAAARTVENDRRNADFRTSGTAKPSARSLAEARAAHATAQEEARGAGLVNFGMVITATVNDADQMPDATAAVDNLSATARLMIRPAYGSQDSAFAAALPLGLVLPAHLRVPAGLRESL